MGTGSAPKGVAMASVSSNAVGTEMEGEQREKKKLGGTRRGASGAGEDTEGKEPGTEMRRAGQQPSPSTLRVQAAHLTMPRSGWASCKRETGRLMAAAQKLRNTSIIRYCCPLVEPCMQTWLHVSDSFRRLHDPSSRAPPLRPFPDCIEVQSISYFAAVCAPLHSLESSLAVLGASYACRIGFMVHGGVWR